MSWRALTVVGLTAVVAAATGVCGHVEAVALRASVVHPLMTAPPKAAVPGRGEPLAASVRTTVRTTSAQVSPMRADLRKPDRRTSGSRKVAVLPTGVFASTSPDTQCPAGASDGASSGFMWPLRAPVLIVRPFDGPAQPWLAGHRGVDLHAPPGTPVVAPAAGVVSFAGIVVDRHLIVIDHGDLRSTLEPVFPCLAPGTFVAAGQQVGVVSAEPPHAPDTVHWGVRRGDVYLDPTLLVCPAPRAVLLE